MSIPIRSKAAPIRSKAEPKDQRRHPKDQRRHPKNDPKLPEMTPKRLESDANDRNKTGTKVLQIFCDKTSILLSQVAGHTTYSSRGLLAELQHLYHGVWSY